MFHCLLKYKSGYTRIIFYASNDTRAMHAWVCVCAFFSKSAFLKILVAYFDFNRKVLYFILLLFLIVAAAAASGDGGGGGAF